MKIARGDIKPYRRRFRTPMITARGIISERCGNWIRLESENHVIGWGDAGHDIYADNTAESAAGRAGQPPTLVHRLIGSEIPDSLDDVNSIVDSVDSSMTPAVRFGIESALCDLSARVARIPLADWLGRKLRFAVPVNYLCHRPVHDWRRLAAKIQDAGYQAVKAKVGFDDIDFDMRFLSELRRHWGGEIRLRLDANRAWTYDRALSALQAMKIFGVDYIEEPLTRFYSEEVAALRKETGIPVALDETLAEVDDIESLLKAHACDILILKPAVLGGLRRTLRLIELAGKYQCRTVITSTYETEIGIAALLHLAANLPDPLLPCGLDTLRLFEDADPALSRVVDGSIALPDGAGIGTDICRGNDD